MQTTLRIGLGHDTHRFTDGDYLMLGGIRIPDNRAFLGHSDADVLLHAIIDAILGAASLGDIGELFPDTAPENRNRKSEEMLKEVHNIIREHGWRIVNLDCIVFLEQPHLGEYKMAIRQNIARLLEIELDQINVKAKTGEQVGPIGSREAAAAECAALICR